MFSFSSAEARQDKTDARPEAESNVDVSYRFRVAARLVCRRAK